MSGSKEGFCVRKSEITEKRVICLGYPNSCSLCKSKDQKYRNLFKGDLELRVKPFRGNKPWIMLVGQDPTISERQVDTVLDLANKGGRLYNYIFGEILGPLGVTPEMVYATNLIKCRFPNNQTPKRICERHKKTMKEFLQPFFDNCRKWFIEEMEEIQPRILISFGEPVHQLLIESFQWSIPKQMKDAFSHVYQVHNPFSFTYMPCIHINSKAHEHYQGLWDEFIKELSRVVQSAFP